VVNKNKPPRRVTSLRVPEKELEDFDKLCSHYDISRTTGLKWLIKKAIKENKLPKPDPTEGTVPEKPV
jgi:hypothetical protein